MDIDKPHQLELLRADMEKQQSQEKRAVKAAAKKMTAKHHAGAKGKPVVKSAPKTKKVPPKPAANKKTK
jgi:hypothetical protein